VASPPGRWRRELRRLGHLVYRAPGERDDCPACGSPDLFELDLMALRRGRIGLVSGCESCGLVFSNPLPTPQVLEEFYSPTGDWGDDRRERPEPSIDRLAGLGRAWTRWFAPMRGTIDVARPPAGARVLDFGCGDGKLLDLLAAAGWETYGVEPATDVAFRRHRRLDLVPEDARFDLVVLNHVLEHVPNPLQLLRQLAGACRPGGHLLVGVPRFDTLPLHRDYFYVLNGRAHITAYTWPCLGTLLARAGWAPVAPPPAQVSKGGGGRLTTSRLRVIARRAEGALAEPARPADAARAAVRGYYAQGDARPLLARSGFLRLAALAADRRQQREWAARKAAARKQRATESEAR
jgi:SAM-dependent methyltransferase